MDWKALVLAIVAIVAVAVFGYINGVFPEFPLTQDKFVALVLWAVGLLVAGWQINKQRYVRSLRLRGTRGIDPATWRPLIIALLNVLVPILYGVIKGWNESFPLTQEDLLALILWPIGLLLGGGAVSVAVYKAQDRLD